MSTTLNTGTTTQFTYQPKDIYGNNLYGVGVPQWSSSNPAAGTLNAVGLFTAAAAPLLAPQTTVISATLQGITGTSTVTVQQAQDSSLADFQSTLGDPNVVGIWDFTDGTKMHINGSTQIDSVDDARGASVGLPLGGAQLGGGSWRPGWDAVNKRAIFTNGQPAQTLLATALDARYRLNDQSLALIIWGAFQASSGSKAGGIIHNDALRGVGIIGTFGASTFDVIATTDASHAYQTTSFDGSSIIDNTAGVTPRIVAICIKLPPITPSGLEGAFPFHSVEVAGRMRALMRASSNNQWTPFITGTCQVVLGGAVQDGDLRGAALVKLDAFPDKAFSRTHMAAIERFGVRLGCSPIASPPIGVNIDGDSRPWGVNVADQNTQTLGEQLQVLLGSGYHVTSRAISGDSWHDRANLNPNRTYPSEYWRQRAGNDKDSYRTTPDIHLYMLDVNDTNGPGTGSGFGNTVASADACLAQFDVEFAALVADSKRVMVCAPIAPIVDPFRTEWLNGLLAREAANPTTLAIARTDQDSRLMNKADTTYFDGDQIHLIAAGYAVVASVVNARRIAKGW